MALPTLSSSAAAALDAHLHDVVEQGHFPAVFFGVANAQEILYQNEDGLQDIRDASKGKVTKDTCLQLYSMTKAVTAVACLQLIDRGLLPATALDDPALVAQYLPEMAQDKLEVLDGFNEDGSPKTRPAKTAITLRMLMSHSSGLAYEFWVLSKSAGLIEWRKANNKGSLMQKGETIADYVQPLLYDPGTSWSYSTGLDFTGELVARVSGKSLEQWFQDEIFKPCGTTSMTLLPTQKVMDSLMEITHLDPATNKGVWRPRAGFGRPQVPEDVTFQSGGAGLYGTIYDYLRFCQGILRSSPDSPVRDSPLLSPSMYSELFRPCLPDSRPGVDAKERLTQMHGGTSYISPFPTPETSQHSAGFIVGVVDSDHGRKAGSGYWSGAAKTMFWIDPASGIAAVCGTQIMDASGHVPWIDCYTKFERIVYDNLQY